MLIIGKEGLGIDFTMTAGLLSQDPLYRLEIIRTPDLQTMLRHDLIQ
jgi:hypothetical protein